MASRLAKGSVGREETHFSFNRRLMADQGVLKGQALGSKVVVMAISNYNADSHRVRDWFRSRVIACSRSSPKCGTVDSSHVSQQEPQQLRTGVARGERKKAREAGGNGQGSSSLGWRMAVSLRL